MIGGGWPQVANYWMPLSCRRLKVRLMWCSSASLGSSVAQRPPLGWAQGYALLATPGFTQLRAPPANVQLHRSANLVGLSDQSETWLRCCAWPLQQAHGLHANVDVDVDVSQGRRGAKLSSSASQPSFPERVGCRGRAPAHGRADRRCQLSARFGTLVAVDTTPMRRPETARQSRSRRRMQGPRTSGLHSQGLPGSASSVVQK